VRTLQALDLHAHVDAAITPAELRHLEAVVFAVTRSLDEAETATRREDDRTIWGVGCHPGLVGAHKAFAADRFADLIERTAFASEIGLDGSSRVPMPTQQATLGAVLGVLQHAPRIASLHSYRATNLILDELAACPIKGAVLHWWLGDARETERALELGCFFSMNASSVRRGDLLDLIPLDRTLTETDHPFGDRRGGRAARPGSVAAVEDALAKHHMRSADEIRLAMWDTLGGLVKDTQCMALLPREVRLQLMAL
jgi:TatD DNase family protein